MEQQNNNAEKKPFSTIFLEKLKRLGISIWHIIKNPLTCSKVIIIITALVHLIISQEQIVVLYNLSDEICGLVLFFFILLGLAAVFNAIRLKEFKISKFVFSILILMATIGCGIWLVVIYMDAIKNQVNVNTALVKKGVAISITMISLYAVGLIQLIVAFVLDKIKKANQARCHLDGAE